ncbi:hypothetical protein [Novosphingobium sp. B 225]|uniref:hypothetical protein n=1 Tax=Novosphingobium sp. B 225 TaxID=1961849 RepID=UPI0020CC141B|nr:hypothetical protein [Novosphingobium sp. B 225]
MLSTVLSVVMLAVLGLPILAITMWRKGNRRQAVLMLILAVVAAVNLAIWTLPDATGSSPVAQQLTR